MIELPESVKFPRLMGDFRPTRDMMEFLSRVNVRKGPLGSVRQLSMWGLEVELVRAFPGLSDQEARETVKYWKEDWSKRYDVR